LQKKLSFLYRSWISIKTDNYTGDLLKSFVWVVSTKSPAVMVSLLMSNALGNCYHIGC
jgi:hypothetical protein